MCQTTRLAQAQSCSVQQKNQGTHGIWRQRTRRRVMGIGYSQQPTDIFRRINVGNEAGRSIGHRGREDSLAHVTAGGCKTEKTSEHVVAMKPGARNFSTFDWKESLTV